MPPGLPLENEIQEDGSIKVSPVNAWWTALEQNPWIRTWCSNNPGTVLYGEVFGPNIQQGFHYGLKSGQMGFVVFDILRKGHWVPNSDFSREEFQGLNFVPTLYTGANNAEVIRSLAEENESFNGAGHIREGVVVKLVTERHDPEIGRLALKHVSNRYFEVK